MSKATSENRIRYTYAINEYCYGDRAGEIESVTLTDYAHRTTGETVTVPPLDAVQLLREAGQNLDAERIHDRITT